MNFFCDAVIVFIPEQLYNGRSSDLFRSLIPFPSYVPDHFVIQMESGFKCSKILIRILSPFPGLSGEGDQMANRKLQQRVLFRPLT